MKRTLVVILLALLLLAPIVGARDIITHTLASVVRIEFPSPEHDEPSICTGFMVAPRRAITAAHCAPEDAGFTVDGMDSIVLKRSELFVLVIAGNKPALKLTTKLKLQDTVTAFGFAWGDMFVFRGHVAAFKDGDFLMDRPLAPGMSGGPTVNQAGDVVGINQSANSVIGIACGAGELRAFLSQ
jgi:hypothetical protein